MPKADFYRVSIVDPITKKQKHKQFSLKKYSEEDAKRLGEEWKEGIRKKADMSHSPADMPHKSKQNKRSTVHEEAISSDSSDSSDSDDARNTIVAPLSKIANMFPIEKFDFERNPEKAMNACSFCIIGSSKSGKTTFLKYLLKEHFGDDIKLFMTQSPQAEVYNSIKRSNAVFVPMYMPELIKEAYKINKGTNNKYKFCVIVDDVVGAKNDKQMTKALCLYRNSALSTLLVGQDFSMLNPIGRANVNNICLFYTNTDNRIEDNVKMFLRSYFPRSLSMEEKIALYRKLTENHCFLWIDCLNNTIKRCKLSEDDL